MNVPLVHCEGLLMLMIFPETRYKCYAETGLYYMNVQQTLNDHMLKRCILLLTQQKYFWCLVSC